MTVFHVEVHIIADSHTAAGSFEIECEVLIDWQGNMHYEFFPDGAMEVQGGVCPLWEANCSKCPKMWASKIGCSCLTVPSTSVTTCAAVAAHQ